MTFTREYPDAPRVGVGAVILAGDEVLLVKRGQPPSQGKWSIPGGLIHLGERIEDAVRREVLEECGVRVRLLGLCGVIDRVRLAPDNGVQAGVQPLGPPGGEPARVHYHYVIIDFAAVVEAGTPRAGSDAAEVRWVPVSELPRYDTTDGLADMVHRAAHLAQGHPLSQGG
ncbi:MAG TPA: NUDIX hydrolase [Methylomirabilota bacterium]|jgi:ADP-ribose pyrophosphatase YjhB (NUDIX family)